MLLHADEALGALDQAGRQQHDNHGQGMSMSFALQFSSFKL